MEIIFSFGTSIFVDLNLVNAGHNADRSKSSVTPLISRYLLLQTILK